MICKRYVLKLELTGIGDIIDVASQERKALKMLPRI